MPAHYKSEFKCTVLTPDAVIYEKEIQSLFLTGDNGEYELLPYHYPILGILKEGNIIIDWKESIPIKFGLIRFFANDCIILIEQHQKDKKIVKKEDEIAFSQERE